MAVSTPSVGDVIVHRSQDASAVSPHGVGIYEGRIQLAARTNREACDLARNFARNTHVDVWNEAEGRFSCLSRFRLD